MDIRQHAIRLISASFRSRAGFHRPRSRTGQPTRRTCGLQRRLRPSGGSGSRYLCGLSQVQRAGINPARPGFGGRNILHFRVHSEEKDVRWDGPARLEPLPRRRYVEPEFEGARNPASGGRLYLGCSSRRRVELLRLGGIGLFGSLAKTKRVDPPCHGVGAAQPACRK